LSNVPVPNVPIPTRESDNSGLIRLNTASQQPPPPPISLAESLGLQYKLVVNATTPSQKATLRSVVPDAFHTWVGDRRMMQAGAFKDETEAKELQERLNQVGLSSQIISIR
jgi:N-acetylmuramoyl-L-alanine amidase